MGIPLMRDEAIISSRILRTISFMTLFILLGCTAAFAFQWPVDSKILTATFGESRWDHFHTGIDIGGGAQEVRPVDSGEVIFYSDSGRSQRALSYGLGTFVVVEHEQGIRSLYAHLESSGVDDLPASVDEKTVLGRIGDSGASLGKHLHLEIIDVELGSYVNPLVVLPSLRDTISPVIKRLSITGDILDEEPVRLERGIDVASGEYRMLVELYDPSEHVEYFCPMAPYQVTGYFNGSEVFDLRFDTLNGSSDGLVIGRGAQAPTFAQLYFDDWIIDVGLVPFRVGEIQVEIVARDMFGNEASYRLPVTVK